MKYFGFTLLLVVATAYLAFGLMVFLRALMALVFLAGLAWVAVKVLK